MNRERDGARGKMGRGKKRGRRRGEEYWGGDDLRGVSGVKV